MKRKLALAAVVVLALVAAVLAAKAYSWADKALHDAALIAQWNG